MGVSDKGRLQETSAKSEKNGLKRNRWISKRKCSSPLTINSASCCGNLSFRCVPPPRHNQFNSVLVLLHMLSLRMQAYPPLRHLLLGLAILVVHDVIKVNPLAQEPCGYKMAHTAEEDVPFGKRVCQRDIVPRC